MDTPETGHAPAAATSARGYEFTPAENAVIEGTARWTGVWGWLAILGGALMGLVGLIALPAGVINLVIGAVYIWIGLYFKRAADSFSSVTTTSGNDITHLMAALRSVSTAFKAMVILMIVGVVLGFVAAILAGVAAVAMTSGAG